MFFSLRCSVLRYVAVCHLSAFSRRTLPFASITWIICCSVCCSVLQCVAVRSRVLLKSAFPRRTLLSLLPTWRSAVCVAVCCSVLQCVAVCYSSAFSRRALSCFSPDQCVSVCAAACCSVLQCVAVCCSVLLCVAVCCSADKRTHIHTKRDTPA